MSQKKVQRNLLLVFCSLLSVSSSVFGFDYCSITKKHTMCSKEGFGPSCGKALGNGVSASERAEIIRVHNELRAKLANGQESFGKPGPQPPAADMEEMVWDDELAIVAQRHADQCLFQHDCAECRKIPRFNVGQNLYIYKQSIREAPTNWTTAVSDWYYEVKLFDKNWVKPFKFSTAIGHYTAMAWSNTNRVGCGLTGYVEGKWFAKLYTCNYGPAGNYINGQMYEQGKACSKCPSGTSCSRSFPGLCAGSTFSTDLSNDIFGEQIVPLQVPQEIEEEFVPQPPTFVAPATTTTTSKLTSVKTDSGVSGFTENRFTPVRKTTTTKGPKTIITTAATTPRTTTVRPTTTTTITTPRTTPTTTTTTTTFPTTTTTFSTTTRTTTATAARTTTTRTTTTQRTTRPTPVSTRLTTLTPTPATTTTTPPTLPIQNEPSPFISIRTVDFEDIIAPKEIFNCDFDEDSKDCRVKFSGRNWIPTSLTDEFGFGINKFYEVTLSSAQVERTELLFSNMVPTPARGVACLNFRYKKFQSGQLSDVPLQVVVWPLYARQGIVRIQRNSPDETTWIRAQVTFRKISNSFLVLFRADSSPKSGQLYLALDDVSVTEGKC